MVRGQLPSPPHSDGHPTPEPHRESCGIIHPLYAHDDILGAGMTMDHTQQAVAFESSNPPRYLANNGYLQQPMAAHSIQVNTPPSTSDECIVAERTSSAWPQRSANRKAKSGRGSGGRKPKTLHAGDGPSLPGPLSELTKHLTHVPIRDMESWVHRPIEVRRQEVTKKNGKVARPMNSFMLYRSAYTERTKKWLGQNNHQVVSVAVGHSWKMEPPEIRNKFEVLANIEKKNHVKAHPGYRFSPKKDHRRGDDRRNSRLDHTPDSSPGLGQTPRTMSTSEMESGWGSRDSTPIGFMEHGMPAGYLSSSWQTTNPASDLCPCTGSRCRWSARSTAARLPRQPEQWGRGSTLRQYSLSSHLARLACKQQLRCCLVATAGYGTLCSWRGFHAGYATDGGWSRGMGARP
ncbi:unnamed protein product [Aspergillus oryzae RIB40]|uniref:DNA, SC009 n=1 Tax=Aspergillus oryzae (strain ATCC 42149 / RIB 40) TaxID=510516 RepID=Q2UU55_ASPOR|nr:unnamed protein product [Aspergillus oryzae RIB40]BAE54910.1 unnamed protein product [Aspergillus oryzae RIB40]